MPCQLPSRIAPLVSYRLSPLILCEIIPQIFLKKLKESVIISPLKEVNDMIKLNGTIKNNEEVINTLKELAGVDLINGEFKAQINHNQREKLISNRAISKSENNGFSRQEHLIAVANIDKLFKGARLLGRFDDIKHGQKDIKILRFENYCIFENKIAKCLITAKETKNNKMHKINIYSLELSAN